ncbi:hypothetical protein [Microcoleus sp. bin38.metabat.b11b12b14.051]|uniref:hypothetical protein n=1 Tax=Microcoleus sp. bin38.metabat.b11b12b14.051 TaxID=2742709 RepID=UPI0025F812D4|nr:hypothetical protein [Microcoleus sp. bin38.metabat.b11b12b14.051]
MRAKFFSLFQLHPEHLALVCSTFSSSFPTSSCDVFAASWFSDRLSSETSMISKYQQMMHNRKLLQHKFSAARCAALWQQMLCRRSDTPPSPATSQNPLVVRQSREL